MESLVRRTSFFAVLVAACGGAPVKQAAAPTVTNAITTRSAGLRGQSFRLAAVARETPPAGWKPAPRLIEEEIGSSHGLRAGGATDQIFTMTVVDGSDHPYGKIEHVDDSEPFYVVAEDDRTLRAYVPIVGPSGEHLTQIYRVHPKVGEGDIAPIGSAIPRVTRWAFDPQDKRKPSFAFTLPVSGMDDFVQLVDEKGQRIPLPPGVVGLIGVKRILGHSFGHDWGGWLVRWEGEKGEGWTLDTDLALKTLDTRGPRWSKPVERIDKFPKIIAIGGIEDDGTCEVIVTHLPNVKAPIAPSIQHRTASTCAEAAKAISDDVVAIEDKRIAAEKVAEDRAKAEREEKKRVDALLAKQQKEREAARAEREAREAPILANWRKELATGNRDKACEHARTLSPTTHAEAYAKQTTYDQGIGIDDYNCVTRRKDLSASDRSTAESAYRRLYDERAMRMEVKPAIGQGKLRDLGSKEPSAAERLKQTNDYTYGSGNASSCPYTDRSLCR